MQWRQWKAVSVLDFLLPSFAWGKHWGKSSCFTQLANLVRPPLLISRFLHFFSRQWFQDPPPFQSSRCLCHSPALLFSSVWRSCLKQPGPHSCLLSCPQPPGCPSSTSSSLHPPSLPTGSSLTLDLEFPMLGGKSPRGKLLLELWQHLKQHRHAVFALLNSVFTSSSYPTLQLNPSFLLLLKSKVSGWERVWLLWLRNSLGEKVKRWVDWEKVRCIFSTVSSPGFTTPHPSLKPRWSHFASTEFQETNHPVTSKTIVNYQTGSTL